MSRSAHPFRDAATDGEILRFVASAIRRAVPRIAQQTILEQVGALNTSLTEQTAALSSLAESPEKNEAVRKNQFALSLLEKLQRDLADQCAVASHEADLSDRSG